jgi:hypothetical protein
MYAVSGVQKLGHLECITSHRQKKKKENVRLYLINIISPNLIHIIARNSLITLSTTSEDRRQERERERMYPETYGEPGQKAKRKLREMINIRI